MSNFDNGEELRSELLPNTFPLPNWVIDKGIWALLDDKERVCYVIVVRKTLGWWKRADRISKTQLVELSGLSPKAVTDAMRNLVQFGLVLRVSENNTDNEGIEWGYQPNHSLVQVNELLERYENKSKVNKERARKMREWQGGMSDTPPLSDTGAGGMSDNEHKTSKTNNSGSKEEPSQTKPKTKKKSASRVVSVPDDWMPQYKAFCQGFGREALDQRELKFWLFGSSAQRGGAKGIRHYYLAQITPDEIERAWVKVNKMKEITISNPNSLFAFAQDVHRKAPSKNDESESESVRERIKKAKEKANAQA